MPDNKSLPQSPILMVATLVAALLSGVVVMPRSGDSAEKSETPSKVAQIKALSKAGDSAKEGADHNEATKYPHSSRRAFEEFWEVASATHGAETANELVEKLDLIDPMFLIATVPDPIDSRFGYRFDAILDDIQMAIESFDWNLDLFWLPWQPTGEQPSRRDTLAPIFTPYSDQAKRPLRQQIPGGQPEAKPDEPKASSEEKDAAPGYRPPLHECTPGVLIFRRPQKNDIHQAANTKGKQQILVVFLVGERPTSGIHKIAFGESLNIISHVAAQMKQNDIKENVNRNHLNYSAGDGEILFPIVGPYFSGSERSISMSLKRWAEDQAETPKEGENPPKKKWRFIVRSGSVNQIDREKFRKDAASNMKGGIVSVDFEATVHHFDDVMSTLFAYLRTQNGGWPLGKVALLTESDTQFGNAVGTITKEHIKDQWHAPDSIITTMKFPFHVSQVAIAYDQNKSSDDKEMTPSLARPSSKLKIPFDETGSPHDIVPALSPGMTAASDEFDLAKIFETIAMEDYRYVGIVATDTRDVIFLSGLIREYCPDVQLFTPAGDLLLGHPTYASQLRGMIVGSPYPLFSMAQRWDPPHEGDHRRHLFMHESDQGYYNATLTLLGPNERQENPSKRYYAYLYDYGKPFGEMDLIERSQEAGFNGRDLRGYVTPSEDLKPPIWIGVIGQRGIWPLDFNSIPKAPSKKHQDYVFLPDVKDVPSPVASIEQFIPLIPQFSWFWGAIVLALSTLAWMVLWVQYQVALEQEDPTQVPSLLRPIESRGRGSSWRPSQEGLVYACIGTLVIVYSYIVMKPCRMTLRHSSWSLFIRDPSLLTTLPWGDFWNWFFGLVSILLSASTCAALVMALTLRIRSTPRTSRPADSAMIAWCLAVLFFTVLLVNRLFILPHTPSGGDGHRTHWFVISNVLALTGLFWIATKWRKSLYLPMAVFFFSLSAGIFFDPPMAVLSFSRSAGVSFDPPMAVFDVVVQVVDAIILAAVCFWADRLAERSQAERSARAQAQQLERGVQVTAVEGGDGRPLVNAQVRDGEGRAKSFGESGSPGVAVTQRVKKGKKRQARPAIAPSTSAPQSGGMPLVGWSTRRKWLAVFLAPMVAGLAILLCELRVLPREPYVPLLFLERAVSLGNGVSPLMPVALAGLTLGTWLFCQLRRLDFIDRLWKDRLAGARENPNPLALKLDDAPVFSAAALRKRRLFRASQSIRELLDQIFPRILLTKPACLIANGLTAIVILRLYERFVPTADGLAFNRAMMIAFAVLIAAVVLSLCRLLLVWGAVRRLLQEFSLMPMQRAFDRVPRALSREIGPYLNAVPPRLQNLERTVRQWARVADDFDREGLAQGLYGKAEGQLKMEEKSQLDELARLILGDGASSIPNERPSFGIMRLYEEECADERISTRLAESRVRRQLREAGAACMSILVPYWHARSLSEGYGEQTRAKGKGEERVDSGDEAKGATLPACSPSPWNDQTRQWLESAEDLLALELVNFVSECTIHLKNLATFLAIGPLLLLLAVSSYPFQPQRFLVVVIWALLIVVASGVLWAYVQMERNDVLSRIAKTSPDRVTFNWSFLTQTAAVTLPLLGVLISQFPFASDGFNQWFEPILRILK